MDKFPLGRTVITAAANALFEESPAFIQECLHRHAQGDWGDLPTEDAEMNDAGLGAKPDRLLSSYAHPDGLSKLWIITESDRSTTTALLPEDY